MYRPLDLFIKNQEDSKTNSPGIPYSGDKDEQSSTYFATEQRRQNDRVQAEH